MGTGADSGGRVGDEAGLGEGRCRQLDARTISLRSDSVRTCSVETERDRRELPIAAILSNGIADAI
jgi:hypothetical protein